MRAIFSVTVPIGGEMPPTASAGKLIHCLFVDTLRVFLPPRIAARIRAELFRFLFRNNFYQFSALYASNGVLSLAVKTITPTERAYCIIRNTEDFSYFNITYPLQTHCSYLIPLLICHKNFLQSEITSVSTGRKSAFRSAKK